MAALRVLDRPSPDELAAIRALEGRAAAADGHESLGAAAWRDLAEPGPESFGLLDADEGTALAYAHVAPADSTATPHLQVGAVTDPTAPDRPGRLAALARAVATALADRAAGPATWWAAGADAATDAALVAAGWHEARAQHLMRVDLPLTASPELPAGTELRRFRPGIDEAALVAVNNRAFAGHAEQGGWTTGTLARRTAAADFDPDDVLLAWDDRGLAAFDWTKVHPAADGEPRQGEIYVVGVDPHRQGGGLGRALVVAGLDHLARARACPVGILYVAADNLAAVALYESLGFVVARTDRAYEWP